MALNPSGLKTQLEQGWLNASFPDNAQLAADRFASAVASWFSAGQAAGFPCGTAAARKGQLSSALATAFASGLTSNTPVTAAQGLATALSSYMAGQLFGAGVALAPTGTAAATSAFLGIFSDLQSPSAARAQGFATACQALALTVIVNFPPSVPPIPPSPVM